MYSRKLPCGSVRRDLEYALDFHAGTRRQRPGADGGTRMLALISKHLRHQIRCAVDDERLLGEFRIAIDEARQANTAHDAIEIAAACDLELREQM